MFLDHNEIPANIEAEILLAMDGNSIFQLTIDEINEFMEAQ